MQTDDRMTMANDVRTLDAFTRAYLECALWSSHDDDGEPLDSRFEITDLAHDSFARAKDECAAFQATHADTLDAITHMCSYSQAGHDFWLTRCRHGAGFRDGDWPEPAATVLTAAAHVAGERSIYVGDDGKLHITQG